MFADQAYDLAEKAHAGQKRRNGIYISNKFEKIKIYKMENNK